MWKVKTIKFLQIFIVPEISYVSIIGLKLTLTKKLKYKKAFEKKKNEVVSWSVQSIFDNNNSWKPLQQEEGSLVVHKRNFSVSPIVQN